MGMGGGVRVIKTGLDHQKEQPSGELKRAHRLGGGCRWVIAQVRSWLWVGAQMEVSGV